MAHVWLTEFPGQHLIGTLALLLLTQGETVSRAILTLLLRAGLRLEQALMGGVSSLRMHRFETERSFYEVE